MARREANCSTGWCVGPSSPTPIESCVKMWITGISISADRRIAPRAKSEKIRNPDQYGRTFVRDIPFEIAADACSRIPKWKLRPERSSAWKSPAPSNVSRVLVDGARSAAPPSSHGTFRAIAFSTWAELSRLAIPLGSAGNSGISPSHPSGSSRRWIRRSSSARSGWASR
jgi:hypothetical protein